MRDYFLCKRTTIAVVVEKSPVEVMVAVLEIEAAVTVTAASELFL